MILSAVFTAIAVLSDGAYALLGGAAGQRLSAIWHGRSISRASGCIYIGLGVTAALSHGRPERH